MPYEEARILCHGGGQLGDGVRPGAAKRCRLPSAIGQYHTAPKCTTQPRAPLRPAIEPAIEHERRTAVYCAAAVPDQQPQISQSRTGKGYTVTQTHRTASLAFFNNKGGVGKTTLSCNMASLIARETGAPVLYIDCDPQCNATQLLLDEAHWTKIFSNRRDSSSHTILKALRHIRAGDSTVEANVSVVRSERFGIDVLPGHPGLSIIEDTLSASWVDLRAGVLGAARRSLWVKSLVDALDYPFVVFDLGPSLGALNRTVLVGSTHFATPISPDLFSLYAIDNIAEWMHGWLPEYGRGVHQIEQAGPNLLKEYAIPRTPSLVNGFLGYTVQQYVARSAGADVRPVRAYDRYKRQIPKRVTQLMEWAPEQSMDPNLGVVPNMFSMVPLAQAAHAPIVDLTTSDGLRGAQISQNRKYSAKLKQIGAALLSNLALSGVKV